MKTHYPVIIAGGGPVGAAMAIELGMQGIETLVLEKYEKPLLSPRAQTLNARSLDLFTRWGILENLRSKRLLAKDFPQKNAWQKDLQTKPLAVGEAAHTGLRIPLYITETVMREKIASLASITFLTQHAVIDVESHQENVKITAEKNKDDNDTQQFSADYLIACDGANSLVRQKMEILFKELGPKRQMLSLLFTAPSLYQLIDQHYIMHLCLTEQGTVAIGPIDPQAGIWYAQIPSQEKQLPSDEQAGQLLNKIAGLDFDCSIIEKHFWQMQIQLAESFSLDQRVFLVGDSAHAFAPNGGLGLNTGLVDATNLAWKLATVIRGEHSSNILNTYEFERRPIAVRNLQAAERNAQDRMSAQNKASNLNNIAKIQANADGITQGYAYFYSNLTKLQPLQSLNPMPYSDYTPTAEPGYFIPNITINNQSVYTILSPVKWTLLVMGEQTINTKLSENMNILHLPIGSYPHNFILLRPDWHIAEVFISLPENLHLPLSRLSI